MTCTCNTYTSGSSTCTHATISRDGLGAACARRHPACGTYGSGEIECDTWAKWWPSRPGRCFSRQSVWQCPRQRTGPRCRCCWLEEERRLKRGKKKGYNNLETSKCRMKILRPIKCLLAVEIRRLVSGSHLLSYSFWEAQLGSCGLAFVSLTAHLRGVPSAASDSQRLQKAKRTEADGEISSRPVSYLVFPLKSRNNE